MTERLFLAAFVLAASGCAANVQLYQATEAPNAPTITFVNDSDLQGATFATFDDSRACTGKRYFQSGRSILLRPGVSQELRISADPQFTLFAQLDTVNDEQYGIDFDVTGGGPIPVVTNTVAAIGCRAIVSFESKPGFSYRATLSAPLDSESCSLTVVGYRNGAMPEPVRVTQRPVRDPGSDSGASCN